MDSSIEMKRPIIKAVDLFCGVGGLTKGLENAGIQVVKGFDIDPSCLHPYDANNEAKFQLKSITEVTIKEITNIKKNNKKAFFLLAGCAPCQPFSSYTRKIKKKLDKRWKLLKEFERLIKGSRPDFVTMENVPRLKEEKVFKDFVKALDFLGYRISYSVVNCADYGVPQNRHRLVLMASKVGNIGLIRPSHKPEQYITVRNALEDLPKIKAGQPNKKDPLHISPSLSKLNTERIKQSRPGGTWRDWEKKLIAKCHKKKTGKTYPSVYGRMKWDLPAPTITTQFFGFGNGRFGHPEQDRALSIKEGALLQSFPKGYEFLPKGGQIHITQLGRLIGNAVPVRLGEAIGKSFLLNIAKHKK